jgi:hypothetical protein
LVEPKEIRGSNLRFSIFSGIRTSDEGNMNRPKKAALRNAANKKGVAIRKNDAEFKAFMEQWRKGLKNRGKEWEGIAAVAELKHKGMFEFLLDESSHAHSRAMQHLFRRMLHEIQSYKKELSGPLAKKRLDKLEDFLERTGTTLQAEQRLAKSREIKEILQRLSTHINEARGAISWSKFKQAKLHFGFSQELLWPEAPRRSLVSRRMELDTSLQVELGKVLLFYLRQKRVSLETVARLILLAYWAGGLSEVSGDFSRSMLTGRILNVRNVRENLRDAKLHKAPGFSNERSPELLAKLQQARKILGPTTSSRLGVLPRLYLSKVATRFGLTKQQIARLIRPERS